MKSPTDCHPTSAGLRLSRDLPESRGAAASDFRGAKAASIVARLGALARVFGLDLVQPGTDTLVMLAQRRRRAVLAAASAVEPKRRPRQLDPAQGGVVDFDQKALAGGPIALSESGFCPHALAAAENE